MVLMSKLSAIEGRKESLEGQHNFTAKMKQRGEINEKLFLRQEETYQNELRSLKSEKRAALRHYVAA